MGSTVRDSGMAQIKRPSMLSPHCQRRRRAAWTLSYLKTTGNTPPGFAERSPHKHNLLPSLRYTPASRDLRIPQRPC